MKTFVQWVEDHNFEMPVVTDTNAGKKDGKGSISEKTNKNFGYNYPAAYARGQYMDEGEPSSYFMSKRPDALYKMTAKPRKVPDTAAN